jgi:hypothetical protein
MKNLLLIICLAFSELGYTQQTTGGCGYSVSVVEIFPGGAVDTLYNGTSYTLKPELFCNG